MMNISKPSDTLVPLLTGAVSAAAVQAREGWWLNPGPGFAFTVAVLFVLGALFGCWRVGSRQTRATASVPQQAGLSSALDSTSLADRTRLLQEVPAEFGQRGPDHQE